MVRVAIWPIEARIRGLGDWVVPAPRKWMAAGDAAQGKPASTKPAVADDSYVRVLAAGGKVLALGHRKDVQQGRHSTLVEREQRGGGPFPARRVDRFAHEGVETTET
jgi:hypothetical protein